MLFLYLRYSTRHHTELSQEIQVEEVVVVLNDHKKKMIAPVVITAVFLLFFFMGMHKGLLRQAVSLIGTIASFYGSWLVSSVLAQYIRIWPQEWAILQDTPYAEAASWITSYCNCGNGNDDH